MKFIFYNKDKELLTINYPGWQLHGILEKLMHDPKIFNSDSDGIKWYAVQPQFQKAVAKLHYEHSGNDTMEYDDDYEDFDELNKIAKKVTHMVVK